LPVLVTLARQLLQEFRRKGWVDNSIFPNGETHLRGNLPTMALTSWSWVPESPVVLRRGYSRSKVCVVALVEHQVNTDAFKQLCIHFIQASATPSMRRLGLAIPCVAT
jgi:hypothetical protein